MTSREKLRITFLIIIIICLVVGLYTSIKTDMKTVINNRVDLIYKEKYYKELISNEGSLSSEANKLKNPEYVARYAKEKYFYSALGEVIIRFN